MDIPTNEPQSLRAGDTWKWTRTFADYPAGTWTLKYRFKNAASGTDHAVTVAAATSATYAAGRYTWMAWVEAGTEKFTVDTGTLEVNVEFSGGAPLSGAASAGTQG